MRLVGPIFHLLPSIHDSLLVSTGHSNPGTGNHDCIDVNDHDKMKIIIIKLKIITLYKSGRELNFEFYVDQDFVKRND